MRALLASRNLPSLAAAAILAVLVVAGSVRFEHFASAGNLSNLLGDYAFVAIAAVGATFVILAGGIDLSVGSMVAFTAMLAAWLVDRGWHPLATVPVCLAIGAALGAAMGGLIHAFALPAFIVTLAGMFALRAATFLLHDQPLGIVHPFLSWMSRDAAVPLGGAALPARAVLMLAVVALGAIVAGRTRFGRRVYALGGSPRSAEAMGVSVGATTVAVYALAGACAALAGVVFASAKRAGDPTALVGLELTVIAAVVIGGTLLSGGVGSVGGTLLGVLILGVIRLLIDFQGNLNAAWTSVATGVLLLAFAGLQRALAGLGGWADRGTGGAARIEPRLPR